MRAILSASLALSLSACGASQGSTSAWLPGASQSSAARQSRQDQPVDRLCLAPQQIAPGITVFCGGFVNITGLATDARGNLYVASGAYSRGGFGAGSIVRLAPNGRASLVTGNRLTGLHDLAVDRVGNVYASTTVVRGWESTTARVYEIASPDRAVRTVVSGLSYAYGLAADGDADVYAATNKGILKIAPGSKVVKASSVAANAVAVDSSGNLYVAAGKNVSEIEAGGTIVSLPGKYVSASAIAVDPGGNVFVGDGGHGTILKITPQRGVLTVARGLDLTGGMALGADGSLYAGGRRTVQRLAPDGAISYAGPTLTYPYAVTADASGNVFVGLPLAHSVVKIAPNATFTTVASQIGFPSGLALDRKGNLYIADSHGGSIKIVSAGGETRTIGRGLSDPTSVAIDSRQNVYVADGKSVKKIDARGTVTKLLQLAKYYVSVSGVTIDPLDNVYASVGPEGEDCFGGIYKISPDGTASQMKQLSYSCFYSIAADKRGNLYLSQRGGTIQEIGVDGRVRLFASGIGPSPSITVDEKGRLYASVGFANAIFRVSPPTARVR